MRRIIRSAPMLIMAILTTSTCGTESPEDKVASPPDWTEAAPSDELGSLVGLGGVAAYRGADDDGDERLNRFEFDKWFGESGIYGRWDTDRDGGLDQDEFYTSAFAHWDINNDQRLSPAEWQQGTGAWLSREQIGTWEDWDGDANGSITPDEYNRELHEHNLYDTLDQNVSGILEPAEIGDTWFNALDANQDTALDEREWLAWSDSSE